MLCLRRATDPAWAQRALADLDAVLVDHAHCELKAATTAMSLAARFVEQPEVVRPLCALAREELDHFERVLGELERRGLSLGVPPVDGYVAELRKAAAASAQRAPKVSAPVDRLICGAIIEARSCERFQLLAAAAREAGLEREAELYLELMASEARHYRTLCDLANVASHAPERVAARLAELAGLEADIVGRLEGLPAIHG